MCVCVCVYVRVCVCVVQVQVYDSGYIWPLDDKWFFPLISGFCLTLQSFYCTRLLSLLSFSFFFFLYPFFAFVSCPVLSLCCCCMYTRKRYTNRLKRLQEILAVKERSLFWHGVHSREKHRVKKRFVPPEEEVEEAPRADTYRKVLG